VIAAALLASAFSVAFVSGCFISLSGLSGGEPGEDRSVEATSDGGSEGGSKDGTKGGKEAGDAAHEADSSAGDVCVPLEFDAGSPTACKDPNDAMCSPQPTTTFTAVYVPPRPTVSVCTAAQISTYTSTCVGNNPDAGACETFTSDSSNASCLSCLVSPNNTSAAEWGPILASTGYVELNVGGCVALRDPCQMPCARGLEAQLQCEAFSCASVCPITDMESDELYAQCIENALECSCRPQETIYEDCQTELVGSPAAECFPLDNFSASAAVLAKVFCGGG
jgi:hypothetical protein